MTTSLSIFIGFFFLLLAVSTGIILPANNDEGKSDYCKKSQIDPVWFVPTPSKCCREKCEKFIKPNESKYGLTNPDPRWSRRLCTCDVRLYRCVSKDLDLSFENTIKRYLGFRQEICFYRYGNRMMGKTIIGERYEFMPVLDALLHFSTV